jgi:hypothetical protein
MNSAQEEVKEPVLLVKETFEVTKTYDEDVWISVLIFSSGEEAGESVPVPEDPRAELAVQGQTRLRHPGPSEILRKGY